MTDAPPFIIDEDAAIDSAFFGSHAGRTCYARGHRSGWVLVLVVRQVVAQRDPPVIAAGVGPGCASPSARRPIWVGRTRL